MNLINEDPYKRRKIITKVCEALGKRRKKGNKFSLTASLPVDMAKFSLEIRSIDNKNYFETFNNFQF